VEHGLVVFRGRCELALDAGVVEEAVDPPIGLDRRLDVSLHVRGLRHVGRHRQRISAVLANDAGGRRCPPALAVHPPHLFARSPPTPLPPRRENATPVARPFPLPPPVTNATLPVKSISPSADDPRRLSCARAGVVGLEM